MASYLHLARYTTAGMKAAMAEGMAGRKAMYEKAVQAVGGTVHTWSLISDGDWDLAVLDEFPDSFDHAASARFSAMLKAAGALEAIRTYRLAAAADFDAAAGEAERTYRAPAALS